jgi:hypothetical protein
MATDVNPPEHDRVVSTPSPAPPPVPPVREASTVETGRVAMRDRRLERETIAETVDVTRDRVRWGPIFAGFLTAVTTLLALSVLGAGIGLTAVNPSVAGATGATPANTGLFSGIWGAISGIIAFLLGGFVAGRTAAVFGRNWGAFNGAMVFFLAVPFTLWLASMGLGSLLGSLGSFAGANPGAAASAASQAQSAAAQVSPEAWRTGAWITFIGLALGLGSAAIGGYFGTPRDLDIDRVTGRVDD